MSGQHHGFLEILTRTCAWLTDSKINAAQILIKRGNPLVSGLQNVILELTNTFDIQTREFIQILHTTGQGHWQHVVSTIGTEHPAVNVFDSMLCHCPDHSKVQILSILMTKQAQFSSSTIMYKCSRVRLTVVSLPLHSQLHYQMDYIQELIF